MAVHRKCSLPSRLLVIFGFVCSRRRAMLNKLWFRELARKWFTAKFEPPPAARQLSEPKCELELRAWYLCYRWLVFLAWLAVLLCSVLEIGTENPLGAWDKWPIYLTNWDLALGLLQALLGALVVSRRWRLQCSAADFDPLQLEYGKLGKLYWLAYVVTSSLALGVTVVYWGMVHDPRLHHVDALNIMIHVGNSLLMLLDFCVAGVPFELRSFYWCPLFVSFYVAFTIVYYLAGGLDKRGKHCIYNILDWQRPGRTLLVCAGGLAFLVLLHCLLCFLARVKHRFYDRRRKSIAITTPATLQTSKPELNAASFKKNESVV